jgi:hypothetical protein
MTDEHRPEFSVAAFYEDGTYAYMARYVKAEAAMRVFRVCAVEGGHFARVIVTDGGDCTNVEWKSGEGITYPPELVGK